MEIYLKPGTDDKQNEPASFKMSGRGKTDAAPNVNWQGTH